MGRILIENVVKSYKTFRLGPINLDAEGNIIGIVGPNGAGKSTLLSIISKTRVPDTGNVIINGKTNYIVSLVPEEGGAQKDATLSSFSEVISSLYNYPSEKILEEMLKEVGKDKNTKFSKLSKGLYRRAVFTAMLTVPADVYILDEPFSGLDVEARYKWKKKLIDFANQGKFIILTSHDMFDIETIVDSVIFMYGGKVVFKGTVDDAKKETGCDTLECSFMNLISSKGNTVED